ncbi:MAG: HD domain-containing phosphohydrolase [Vibrio sp.]
MKKHRYSLSIHISSLFVALILFIGSTLIAISYYSSQQLLNNSAKRLADENGQKLEIVFRENTSPILTTLDFLANSSFITESTSPIKERRWLTSILEVFKLSPNLVALYYGDNEGQFTMLRPMLAQEDQQRFDAPENARLFMNITQTNGSNDIYFFDEQLELIEQRHKQDNQFDPRVRPWFVNAQSDGEIRLTDPYLFYFLQTNGITLSRRSANGKQVLGADFTLESLSHQIATMAYSPRAELILFDKQFHPLARHNTAINTDEPGIVLQTQLNDSLFAPILNRVSSQILYETTHQHGIDWAITLIPVALSKNVHLLLAQATPQEDLLSDLLKMRNNQIGTALVLFAFCFSIVWWVAKRISSPLKKLVQLTDNIARFDFKKTRYPQTMIKEVADLTQSIQLMEHTLHDLLRLLRETASNQDFSELAKTIAHQSYVITKAETIMLYVYSQETDSFTVAANHAIIPFKIEINQLLAASPWLLTALRKGDTVHLNRQDNALHSFQEHVYNADLYFFPLLNRDRQLVGIINLGYERPIPPAQLDKHAFLREVLSFAEIAKDNIDKMQQQKNMLNAFVELIASAIDTKSPYTGGHCQRVPELTRMLTEVAIKDKQYFAEFSMTSEQWEELNLAAWLHDCGKVTTPEYVVDKATKLETIYDRIHEIRMRFELLKMEAERDYWKTLYEGGDAQEAKQKWQNELSNLDDEFTFVAKCNLGGEGMCDTDIARLEQIAKRQWQRTLDDQIGISWVEKSRAQPSPSLPVMENLLADKAVHQIPWLPGKAPHDLWQEEFCLKPPALQYHRGELHNLKIRRGTLTDEERFMINDHIVQTLLMLKRLPYPKHLSQVPEIAGGHHERMDGKGYPRGLNENDLSIPARVMAIADVFEALTSSDRPYKKAKPLTECMAIMTKMALTGHIDPKLYLLFLQHNLHQQYAEQFLKEEQYANMAMDTETHIQTLREHLRSDY